MRKFKENTTYKVTLREPIELFENDNAPEYWQHIRFSCLSTPRIDKQQPPQTGIRMV